MGKIVFNGSIELVNKSKRKPNADGLAKGESFLINLCING